MSTKIVNICIPECEQLPDIVSSFTPEENYLMLKIGIECLKEGRKAISTLTQKEIYNKLKEETKKDIQKLEMDLLVQKQIKIEKEEDLKLFYKSQLDKQSKEIKDLQNQILKFTTDSNLLVQQEIEKEKEKNKIILEEKEKQINRLGDSFEKLIKQTNTSMAKIGISGEKTFEDIALTFKDFENFNLINKTKQGGEGDFHLQFKEFDLLVDAKNYTNGVPIGQREKIKKDLLKNEHINFAWLVSLNTRIDKFDRAPIMYEWITTSKCIIYINNLTSYDEPEKILRIAWFICKELVKLIDKVNNNDEEDDINELRNKQFKIIDRIKSVRKHLREINTTVGVFKKQVDTIDMELKELIEIETESIVESSYSVFDEWWDKTIELTENEEDKLTSSELWIKFKQENKKLIDEFNLTPEKFRQYLKTKLPPNYYLLRSKGVSSAFDLKFVSYKKVKKGNIKLELAELNKK